MPSVYLKELRLSKRSLENENVISFLTSLSSAKDGGVSQNSVLWFLKTEREERKRSKRQRKGRGGDEEGKENIGGSEMTMKHTQMGNTV